MTTASKIRPGHVYWHTESGELVRAIRPIRDFPSWEVEALDALNPGVSVKSAAETELQRARAIPYRGSEWKNDNGTVRVMFFSGAWVVYASQIDAPQVMRCKDFMNQYKYVPAFCGVHRSDNPFKFRVFDESLVGLQWDGEEYFFSFTELQQLFHSCKETINKIDPDRIMKERTRRESIWNLRSRVHELKMIPEAAGLLKKLQEQLTLLEKEVLEEYLLREREQDH